MQRIEVAFSTLAHSGGKFGARNLTHAFLTSSRTQICLGASFFADEAHVVQGVVFENRLIALGRITG